MPQKKKKATKKEKAPKKKGYLERKKDEKKLASAQTLEIMDHEKLMRLDAQIALLRTRLDVASRTLPEFAEFAKKQQEFVQFQQDIVEKYSMSAGSHVDVQTGQIKRGPDSSAEKALKEMKTKDSKVEIVNTATETSDGIGEGEK